MPEYQQWFSAKARLVSMVEGDGAKMYLDTLLVFTVSDWDAALDRAVALGRAREEEHRNADGRRVRWVLKEILSLDVIASKSLDGAEVHSSLMDVPTAEQAMLASEFDPDSSTPVQTL
jgi:hypothetical protein